MIEKIISGGQTGCDMGALRAARELGLQTGGWCPPDCCNEAGKIPEAYNLKPTPEEHSDLAPDIPRSLRTQWNVRDADATLLFEGPFADPGSTWTRRCAESLYKKPLLIIPDDFNAAEASMKVRQWLQLQSETCKTLNVAGPPASLYPPGDDKAFSILMTSFN